MHDHPRSRSMTNPRATSWLTWPIHLLNRCRNKSPQLVLGRLLQIGRAYVDRWKAPRDARKFGVNALCVATNSESLDDLWLQLGRRPYPVCTRMGQLAMFEESCPGSTGKILEMAQRALFHQVDLLGSGPVHLGEQIDWHRDYKTNHRWPPGYSLNRKYINLDLHRDVKVPWEISRIQWLIPAAQAYLLTRREIYAEGIRKVLEDWIGNNEYACSINWACPMEAALRIMSWTLLFHACKDSQSWRDVGFRARFLGMLYLHGQFTERYLEKSDVNGNHLTADAAGLVFAGLFFGRGDAPRRWLKNGWLILSEEMTRQVSADGVDYEGSVAYHRFVGELFLLAALYRQAQGLNVPDSYKKRLRLMGDFTASYSTPLGNAPLWGDSDNARALPLGNEQINDHRYFASIVEAAWGGGVDDWVSSSKDEMFWLLGPPGVERLQPPKRDGCPIRSRAFTQGGYFILRGERDHVFIDCANVGLAGRGGHGHNDCLSFEAVLDGSSIVTDCGSYVYTASYQERNLFRSTRYHNTPLIDGEEQNEFISPFNLWNLHFDASPEVRAWQPGPTTDVFQGAHRGYRRLANPVTPVRTFALDHTHHVLVVQDRFEGAGDHIIEVPLHLTPGITISEILLGQLVIRSDQGEFLILWGPSSHYSIAVGNARVSPSYGVIVPSIRIAWHYQGSLNHSLTVAIGPRQLETRQMFEKWAQQ